VEPNYSALKTARVFMLAGEQLCYISFASISAYSVQ